MQPHVQALVHTDWSAVLTNLIATAASEASIPVIDCGSVLDADKAETFMHQFRYRSQFNSSAPFHECHDAVRARAREFFALNRATIQAIVMVRGGWTYGCEGTVRIYYIAHEARGERASTTSSSTPSQPVTLESKPPTERFHDLVIQLCRDSGIQASLGSLPSARDCVMSYRMHIPLVSVADYVECTSHVTAQLCAFFKENAARIERVVGASSMSDLLGASYTIGYVCKQ